MDSGNWTAIIVELIRAIAKYLVAKMRMGHRDSDGGPTNTS